MSKRTVRSRSKAFLYKKNANPIGFNFLEGDRARCLWPKDVWRIIPWQRIEYNIRPDGQALEITCSPRNHY